MGECAPQEDITWRGVQTGNSEDMYIYFGQQILSKKKKIVFKPIVFNFFKLHRQRNYFSELGMEP